MLRIQLTISQHWSRLWLAPTRRQAIVWTIMLNLLTHIRVIRPQWVNSLFGSEQGVIWSKNKTVKIKTFKLRNNTELFFMSKYTWWKLTYVNLICHLPWMQIKSPLSNAVYLHNTRHISCILFGYFVNINALLLSVAKAYITIKLVE